jgi:hypothetical protein
MPFNVQLLEQDDSVLEIVVLERNFNPVLKRVDRSRFPVMGSLDPYRDTVLDAAQCDTLRRELLDGADFLESVGVTADGSLRELNRLCALVQAEPRLRIEFVGD